MGSMTDPTTPPAAALNAIMDAALRESLTIVPYIDPATHAAALRVVEAARGAEGMTYRMDKTLREALAAFDAAKGGE